MEIALMLAVGVDFHSIGHTWLEFQPCVHDERAARAYERGEMCKTLEIVLIGAIDVEVVGIGRRHHSDVGAQVMKRAVKLVGLNHRELAGAREQEIAVVVAQHPSQESVAANSRHLKDMGRHARRGGLAMRSGKAQSLAVVSDDTQHLGTLYNLKSIVTEVAQPGMVAGHRRRVNHQRAVLVAAVTGNEVGVLVVDDFHPFLFQSLSEFTGCAVISRHLLALSKEIALQRSHPNATGSHEI